MTERNLANSEPSCGTCPVALGLQDRDYEAAVGYGSAVVSIPRVGFAQYRLPRAGRQLTIGFDAGETVAPLTFRLTRFTNVERYP